MAKVGEEVSNKQLTLRDYVTGSPKESDMYVKTSTIKLEIPDGSKAILVKNLYQSCDPVMLICMKSVEDSIFTSYTPGSVSLSWNFQQLMKLPYGSFIFMSKIQFILIILTSIANYLLKFNFYPFRSQLINELIWSYYPNLLETNTI